LDSKRKLFKEVNQRIVDYWERQMAWENEIYLVLPRSQSQAGNAYWEAPPPLQSGTARTAFPA
jgi:hypothetical protein